jgi:hypothetical protein
MKKPRIFKIVRQFLAVSVTILFCVFILEVGLRFLGRTPTNVTEGIAEEHQDSYRFKKNAQKAIRWPSYSYEIYTNSYGFRDKEVGERNINGKLYHVFLGASDVFGNGVNFENTFVGIFAEYARGLGHEVLNLAIGGHYFLDQEALLKDFIRSAPQKPSTIFFCVNALHIPKFDKRNQHIVVKSGHTFEKDGWKLAYVRVMIGDISSAYCFFRDNVRKLQVRFLNHQFKVETPEFLNIYAKSNRMYDPETIKRFQTYLSDFERFCHLNGMEVVFVYLPLSDSFDLTDLLVRLGENPSQYDADYYERLMISYCERTNARLINPTPVLRKYHDEGVKLRFDLDPHFNIFANKVIGEHLITEFFSKNNPG